MSDQESQAPIFYLNGDDADQAQAMGAARQNFRTFWRELSWEQRRIVPGFDLVVVKIAFSQGSDVEHMWVEDVDFDGETVSGTLLNSPHHLTNLAEGDDVQAPLARLSDWMMASEREVLGGFTVQAMRAGMSEEDRSAHDDAWGLDFGDPREVALPPDGNDHPMAVNMADKLEEQLKEDAKPFLEVDPDGWTMLHREALAGNRNIVGILLDHGADLRATTPDGKTPLALAKTLDWQAVVQLLVKRGAK